MTAVERLTPAVIADELDVLDGEAKRALGGTVVSIGFTNAVVKDLAPAQMEAVAAHLLGLLERAPLKSGPAYVAHRMVYGALATELRGFAAAAGEPVGAQADLRGASSKAEEQRIRARLADEAAAFDRHIDEVLIAQSLQAQYEHSTPSEEDPADPTPEAAPTESTDDALAYL